jgi:mRNA-degrading endonuclease toxin of MazEF toxin-antitoxin module
MVRPACGEIVLVAKGAHTSKPRPVLVLQSPEYRTGESIVVVPFTTVENVAVDTRIAVTPTTANGLDRDCFLEIDKISAIDYSYIGQRVGRLETEVLNKATQMAICLISPSLDK